jgi:hypothetical protein
MPFVRRELRVLHLKRIPELHLRLDETAERGTRVLSILQALEEGAVPGDAGQVETLPTPRSKSLPLEPAEEAEPVDQPVRPDCGRTRRGRRSRP